MKYGFNVSGFFAILFIILKRRRVKKLIAHYIPWLSLDAADVANYEARQIRIEEDVRAIKGYMEASGWDAHYGQVSKLPSVTDGRENSLSPTWEARVPALSTGGSTIQTERLHHSKTKGENTRMKKLLSRKFILAVAGAVLIILNDGLNLGIDSNTVLAFAGLIATWIVGESAVDAKRAGGNNDGKFSTPTEPTE